MHVDQDALRRQVLEQMRGALEEQRQEELQAPGGLPGAHIAIDRLLGQIAGKAQPVATAEFAHGVRVERCFPGGEQLNAVQLVARALRIRIEKPDAVDVPVQHVDAVGAVRAHGKHVEQGAADREFPVSDHLRHGSVSGRRQLGSQRLHVQGLAHVHFE